MLNKTQISKQALLEKLYEPHKNLKESPLYIEGCSCIVFGEGNPDADLLFIGEAPGKNEDLQGRPFVGQSGRLLNRAFELAGIKRDDVFITNIVKCRPPNNRTPLPHELKTGKETLLDKQIDIIQPRIICTLGSAALNGLLEMSNRITQVRGTPTTYKTYTLLPVYHPAYVLRNRSEANTFLQDIFKAVELSQKMAG